MEDVYEWLLDSGHRATVMGQFDQPLTGKQIGKRTGLPLRVCSQVLAELSFLELVHCLNQQAQRSRVYWLTEPGVRLQRRLRQDRGLAPFEHDFPVVDWSAYGWVVHRHREAVIKALTEPLQPSMIKRRARMRDASLRASAGNFREILYLFSRHGLVQPLKVPGKAHRHYELTEMGRRFRTLLLGGEVMP